MASELSTYVRELVNRVGQRSDAGAPAGDTAHSSSLSRPCDADDVVAAYQVFLGRYPNEKDIEAKSGIPQDELLERLVTSPEFARKLRDDDLKFPWRGNGTDENIAALVNWVQASLEVSLAGLTPNADLPRLTWLDEIGRKLLDDPPPHLERLRKSHEAAAILAAVASRARILTAKAILHSFLGSAAAEFASRFQKADWSGFLSLLLSSEDVIQRILEVRQSSLSEGEQSDELHALGLLFREVDRALESLPGAPNRRELQALIRSIDDAVQSCTNAPLQVYYSKYGTVFTVEILSDPAGNPANVEIVSARRSDDNPEPARFSIEIPHPALRVAPNVVRVGVDASSAAELGAFVLVSLDGGAERLLSLEGLSSPPDVHLPIGRPERHVLLRNGVLFIFDRRDDERELVLEIDGAFLAPVPTSGHEFKAKLDEALAKAGARASTKFGYVFEIPPGKKGRARLWTREGVALWTGELRRTDMRPLRISSAPQLDPASLEIFGFYVEPNIEAYRARVTLDIEIESEEGETVWQTVAETSPKHAAPREADFWGIFPTPYFQLPVPAKLLDGEKREVAVRVYGSDGKAEETRLNVQVDTPFLEASFEQASAEGPAAVALFLERVAASGRGKWIAQCLADPRTDIRAEDAYQIALNTLMHCGDSEDHAAMQESINDIWRAAGNSDAFFNAILRRMVKPASSAGDAFENRVIPASPQKEKALDALLSDTKYHVEKVAHSIKAISLTERLKRSALVSEIHRHACRKHPKNRELIYWKSRILLRQGFTTEAEAAGREAVRMRKDYSQALALVSTCSDGPDDALRQTSIATNLIGVAAASHGQTVSVQTGRLAAGALWRNLPAKAVRLNHNEQLDALLSTRDALIGKPDPADRNISVIFAPNVLERTYGFARDFERCGPEVISIACMSHPWLNEMSLVGDWCFVFFKPIRLDWATLETMWLERGQQFGMLDIHEAKYADQTVVFERIGFLARSEDIGALPRCTPEQAADLLSDHLRALRVVYSKAR